MSIGPSRSQRWPTRYTSAMRCPGSPHPAPPWPQRTPWGAAREPQHADEQDEPGDVGGDDVDVRAGWPAAHEDEGDAGEQEDHAGPRDEPEDEQPGSPEPRGPPPRRRQRRGPEGPGREEQAGADGGDPEIGIVSAVAH